MTAEEGGEDMAPSPGRRIRRLQPAIHDGESADIEMPSLGAWLRRVRDDRNLTRQQAADRANISVDYINKIDRGYVPTREVVERLIIAYDMNPMQGRHTRHLWEPAVPLPSIDELRERIDTPSRREALAHMDKIGMLCVYIDPLWNILSANEAFYHALPGLDAANHNVGLWLYHAQKDSSPARSVTLTWEQEALFHTAMTRGALGLYRTSPRAKELLEQLKRYRDFRRIWSSGIHVAYARQPSDLAHLRDPSTGQPYSISVDIAELGDNRDIRVCQAFRQPQASPPASPVR
ncbi:helix-turn-helix domain-containing protein [Nocardia sp. NPDC059246]|uniref:helix-turn-helix domain-containing protein n=1 Tax=unclassified Nocardia TaxID=2637762 RepID=UPI0036CC179C